MNWIVAAEDINQAAQSHVGGKGYALALLAKGGFPVSKTLCVTSETYQEYVSPHLSFYKSSNSVGLNATVHASPAFYCIS